MGRLGLKAIFDPRGRINRVDFFIGGLLLGILGICLNFAVETLARSALPMPAIVAAEIALMVPMIYGQFCLIAKRLHDLNLPAALALLAFAGVIFTLYVAIVPPAQLPTAVSQNVSNIDKILTVVGIICGLLLLFVPGTSGENRYGRRSVAGARPQAHDLQG